MPTYEFRCPKGHDFEKFYRSMSAAPLQVTCPTCGKTAERQFSAGAGLVFKGSGFYITDYGKDGKKVATPAAAAGEGGSTKVPGESGGKSDPAGKSEPAGKSDSKSAPESKSGTEAKPGSESKPATASKSAAKKSSGRAKSSE
jgi:putative FmdB family regulatory protein